MLLQWGHTAEHPPDTVTSAPEMELEHVGAKRASRLLEESIKIHKSIWSLTPEES